MLLDWRALFALGYDAVVCLVMAVAGTLLFLVRLGLTYFGGGGSDFDLDADFDSDSSFTFLLSRFDYSWLRYPGMKITPRPRSRSEPARTAVTGITTTGEQGRGGGFRFEWVPPGEYVVVLEAQRGIKRQERVITVAARQKIFDVPPFIISAKEHPLIADPD